MGKHTALIERARVLRAWLESCPPEDSVRRLWLMMELMAVYEELIRMYEELAASNK